MTLEELKHLVEEVGERQGWDFSRLRDERDPVLWDYLEVVRKYLRPSDHVLDEHRELLIIQREKEAQTHVT